ncbi:uncharacterized protein F5Z01DRAFT_646558 [Emericellopsis atlantica]|uniref:Uncharacterized protein n=1 Tax=Emericellopsis atlantica TaxID=2614577 RepID=A0A9P7ZTP4_9HYPO|nr:uncharacterized protein F5Z01DRAFT_646558 [Emericellopsis atlantica]KAG9257631.1 hypothetical protein F5Z01DRAFT_646558 [Emericellopsis atlantica]
MLLLTLLSIMVPNPFQACEGAATFQEEYRGSFRPDFVQTSIGHQIVAPDSPYVAVAGQKQLYFLDTRHHPDTAAHIKNQIEKASVTKDDELIFIDEIEVTAEVRNGITGETTFVFDPPYARVIFAATFNRANPDLKLPVHGPPGDWRVEYEPQDSLEKGATSCLHYGCHTSSDDLVQSNSRVDNYCTVGQSNARGICSPLCGRKVDTPRMDGETDADYYQRMDKLHWGDETISDAE